MIKKILFVVEQFSNDFQKQIPVLFKDRSIDIITEEEFQKIDLLSDEFVNNYEIAFHSSILSASPELKKIIGEFDGLSDYADSNSISQESSDVFKNLLDNIKFIAVMMDLEGNITYSNDAFCDMTGWNPDEIHGKNWFDVFIPEERLDNAKTMFLSMMQSGFVLTHYEDFIQNRDGERRLIFWNNAILRDSTGKIIGAARIGDDVTIRRRAEMERHVFANLGTSLAAAKTIDDVVEIISRETEHLFGWEYHYTIMRNAENVDLYSKTDFVKTGKVKMKSRRRWQEMELVDPYLVLMQGKPVIVNKQLGKENHDIEIPEFELDFGSMMFVPVTSRNHVIGIISVQSKIYRKYNEDYLNLLERFAETTGPVFERIFVEENLRISEERYALAAKAANDCLWDWDIINNHIYFSPRWESVIGYSGEELENNPEKWFALVHEDDITALKMQINTQIKGFSDHLEFEYRIKHKNGIYRWVLIRGTNVRDDSGKCTRLAGSQTDITERKNSEQQLLHGAFYDTLTDLPNRALFLDRLGRGIERSKRARDYQFAVLFLDIDRFKNVNDTLGHATGDQLLIDIAGRLKKCIRPTDTVARLGGDEFTVFLDDIKDCTVALTIASRIHQEIGKPFKIYNNEIVITTSIGIAPSTTGYDKADDILRDADTAMYQAKGMGKACNVIFDKEMHSKLVNTIELENDLRKAIENDELQVFYQPIVSAAEGTIKGFEALIRWFHPKRGIVSPGEFIPIAEDNGMISSIARWVLVNSCRQLNKWNKKFTNMAPLRVSVNISGKWFSQESIVDQIQDILKDEEYNPKHLVVEVTESTVMTHAEETIKTLKRLRESNIKIAIDDFGTGYSSLSYLHKFPIDVLKIDRSFVMRMTENEESLEIVRTILTLAKTLKINVVAEGVETAEQLALLREHGCDLLQGYYLARPADSEKIEALLEKNPKW